MKMLSCRTLLRIDRVLRFTSRCVKPKPKSFSIMSFRGNEAMDGFKKQKMANLVWRPISTQSSSVIAEAGNEVQEAAQCSKSSDVSGELTEVKMKELLNETASGVSAEKYSVSLEVGASLIRFIRGKEGTTQTQIEEEMGVKIILPSSRNEDHIIIEGSSADSITKASERIITIIDEVVKSPSLDYSHFVSLPLAIHPGLVDKLVNFQNSILGNNSIAGDEQDDQANRSNTSVAVNLEANSETNQVNVDIKSIPTVSYPPKTKEKSSTLLDMGIEKSIFIKPNTFHLTVLMLKLWNKERVKAAQDVLKGIYPSVMDSLDNRPIFIRLKGLDCMRGPFAKARVLYVPVEEIGNEGRLLRACQVITDAFVKAGLVLEKDAKHSLKLHATVMNARHRKRRKDNRKKMESFDAREIHKQFGNEDWGEYLIREAHLSQRFVFDQSGYYRCCASITFPGEQRA